MNEMKSNGQFSKFIKPKNLLWQTKIVLFYFYFLIDGGVDAYWENNIQYNLSTLSLFK